jgi:hypothetical protein
VAVLCGLGIIGVVAPWSSLVHWMEAQYGVEFPLTDEMEPWASPEAAPEQEEGAISAQDEAAFGMLRQQYRELAATALRLSRMHERVRAMFEYCLRIACAACAFVGMYFLLLSARPSRYPRFINLSAAGLICTGFVAIIAGAGLGLRARGYVADAAVMWVLGLVMLAWNRQRRRKRRTSNNPHRTRRRRSKRIARTRDSAGEETPPSNA